MVANSPSGEDIGPLADHRLNSSSKLNDLALALKIAPPLILPNWLTQPSKPANQRASLPSWSQARLEVARVKNQLKLT